MRNIPFIMFMPALETRIFLVDFVVFLLALVLAIALGSANAEREDGPKGVMIPEPGRAKEET